MTATRDSKRPPRLGQHREARQQRSIETQRKLLDNTIACLVESGYARLTTAAISERSGVSQGALFLHYPTKADLIVAAVERAFAELTVRFRRGMQRETNATDTVGSAVRVLWRIMKTPEYLATNEVYLAARSEQRLAEAIRPMARRHQAALLENARALYGNSPQHEDVFDMLILTIQAAAIDSVALQDPATDRRRLAYIEALARRELAGARPVAVHSRSKASKTPAGGKS